MHKIEAFLAVKWLIAAQAKFPHQPVGACSHPHYLSVLTEICLACKSIVIAKCKDSEEQATKLGESPRLPRFCAFLMSGWEGVLVLQESHVVSESSQLLLVRDQRQGNRIRFLGHYHTGGRISLPTLLYNTFNSLFHGKSYKGC